MATYLVTGSSRGLGLEIVTQLAAMPPAQVDRVFATARSDSSSKLRELVQGSSGRIVFVKLDAEDKTSIKDASAEVEKMLGTRGLDVLINNVGIMPKTPNGIETMDDLTQTLDVNVTSTHRVTSAFVPLLRKGAQKKVFNISTTLASMTMAPKYMMMPVPAYKISKSALNMLTVQYALSFEKEDFTFITISPGWLSTDMGNAFGVEADLPVAAGATAVLEAVHKYGKEDSGKFYNIRVPGWEKNEGLNQYDGLIPPW